MINQHIFFFQKEKEVKSCNFPILDSRVLNGALDAVAEQRLLEALYHLTWNNKCRVARSNKILFSSFSKVGKRRTE